MKSQFHQLRNRNCAFSLNRAKPQTFIRCSSHYGSELCPRYAANYEKVVPIATRQFTIDNLSIRWILMVDTNGRNTNIVIPFFHGIDQPYSKNQQLAKGYTNISIILDLVNAIAVIAINTIKIDCPIMSDLGNYRQCNNTIIKTEFDRERESSANFTGRLRAILRNYKRLLT